MKMDHELLGEALQKIGVKPEKRRARIVISFELLKEALDLPEGTKIAAASADVSCMASGALFLSVEHPDLRPVACCDASQLLVPRFSQNWDTATQFEGWGQE